MLKIGDFSKLARVSIRMLRHYDEIGLLEPKVTDSFTGYRYYDEEQLPVVEQIVSLKNMGFSLGVITEILSNYSDPDKLEEFLKVKYAEVKVESEEINNRLLLLETAIKRLREDDEIMKYNVTLKTLPQRYVASVRMVIPSYDQEMLLWQAMGRETAAMDLQFDPACCSLAIFHDEGYKEDNVDVEIQVTVKGSYENTENVIFKTQPEVEMASATYKGSYDQITKVNQSVANWVRDNGYEFNGPMFCIYHVSPSQTQNPEELVTEVCCPVKKAVK